MGNDAVDAWASAVGMFSARAGSAGGVDQSYLGLATGAGSRARG